jgi:hypothetical protein
MPDFFKPSGTVTLFLVLILGSFGVLAAGILARSGVDLAVDTRGQVQAARARAILFGCVDEVLIQLTRDAAWNETEVVTSAGACVISLEAPGPEERRVEATWTGEGLVRSVQVELTVDPIVITGITEEAIFEG